MILNIADKGLKLDEKAIKILNRNLEKLNKILPHFNPDLPSINFFIRKNDDKYHIKRKYRHTSKDYTHTKSSLAHFEGWIRLILPRKALYTHFKGATVDECIHTGVNHLIKEIKKYKDLHFKSQSQYPNRASIKDEKTSTEYE